MSFESDLDKVTQNHWQISGLKSFSSKVIAYYLRAHRHTTGPIALTEVVGERRNKIRATCKQSRTIRSSRSR